MFCQRDNKCAIVYNQRFQLGSTSRSPNPTRSGLTSYEMAAMDRTSWRMSRTSPGPVHSCWPGNPYPDPSDSANSALSHAIYGQAPKPPIKPTPKITVKDNTICVPLRRPGVKVGCQPLPYETKLPEHHFTWNKDLAPAYNKCKFWHCKLPWLRDNSQRPW